MREISICQTNQQFEGVSQNVEYVGLQKVLKLFLNSFFSTFGCPNFGRVMSTFSFAVSANLATYCNGQKFPLKI